MPQRQQATSCLSELTREDLQDALACPAAALRSGEALCSDSEMLLQKPHVTPVPKLQLATLCFVRLVDPISFTQIFPYVNEMMQDLGLANTSSQVGFYSGLVDSTFAISQMLSIYHWAKVSDVIGRRPVILAGVIGVAFTTITFGLSRTFVTVLLTRFLAGILAGNIATIHAAMGEITDSSNQAIAFPIYGLCWPLGSIIGPLIGGTFSHPAENFRLFRHINLFRTYPYILPCFIAAVISLLAAIVGWFLLQETLPSKRRKLIADACSQDRVDTLRAYGTVTRTNLHQGEPEDSSFVAPQDDSSSETGMFTLLTVPSLRALSASGFALSFLSGAFDVVFVLFCFSPISTGGLGYPAAQIGYALAIAGVTAALLQLLVMPSLLRRVAPATVYKFCMKLWPIAYMALPLLNILARMGLEDPVLDPDDETLKPAYAVAVWICIGACLAITRVGNLAYSLSMILVKETSPSPSTLGAANGLVQFSMCMARAIAPAFVSALFATSVNNYILGSYFWIFVMVCLGIIGIRVSENINVEDETKPTNKV